MAVTWGWKKLAPLTGLSTRFTSVLAFPGIGRGSWPVEAVNWKMKALQWPPCCRMSLVIGAANQVEPHDEGASAGERISSEAGGGGMVVSTGGGGSSVCRGPEGGLANWTEVGTSW